MSGKGNHITITPKNDFKEGRRKGDKKGDEKETRRETEMKWIVKDEVESGFELE
uniref:Uncharacterized protein n=1 Tax=Cucumis melo TaxID=3656 RepID=A0A9I9D4F1_CUCME